MVTINVTDGIFDARVWSVASAFFLVGKDNGSIALIDMTDKQNSGSLDCFVASNVLIESGQIE